MTRKKILIVNCYFDELRMPVRRTAKIQAMAPAFLAGMFSARGCDIRLYNEQYSGPLEDPNLLSWPDLLVLSGLNTAFDRMLHVTAYAKTKNNKVVVAAGGPAIRVLAGYARRFFDYTCCGDIEQLAEVIEDIFGREYLSDEFLKNGWALPRYDLAYWTNHIIYVESSRNCYFRCGFCSLTGEKVLYRMYQPEYLRQQLTRAKKHLILFFLDNNFASPDPEFMQKRFELIREFKEKGKFSRWGALVSSDFFNQKENLELLRQSACQSIFSGVESFDGASLKNWRKLQNLRLPQVEIIRRCLRAGVSFHYGMMFDLSARSLKDIRAEIEYVVQNHIIPLPCFTSLAIPLLGTPYFYQCAVQKKFLPNIKLRDLDGTTIVLKPLDPLPAAAEFVRQIQNFSGYHMRVLKHGVHFLRKSRKVLPYANWIPAFYSSLALCAPNLLTAPFDACARPGAGLRRPVRTHIGSTEPLDAVYKPAFRVHAHFESYFRPTMLTDVQGALNEELQEDIGKQNRFGKYSSSVIEAVHAAS